MWKFILTLILAVNVSFAQERFSREERQQFLDEIKQEINEGKKLNGGVLTFELIKPDFYEELDHYHSSGKFTREEMLRLKQNFETLAKSNVPKEKVADVFLAAVERDLEEINKRSIPLAKAGELCNELTCAKGLTCAADPVQVAFGNRKAAKAECVRDSECASYSCIDDPEKEGKMICEEVHRCYAPLSLGQSCNENPVCGAGVCLPYDSMTSGIGECRALGNSCKVGSDCCSNSCVSGRCEANYQCKDCLSSGARADKNQKCCEGLYKNEAGVCVPDLPPTVIKEVRLNQTIKSAIVAFASVFINTANADEIYNTVRSDRQKYENFVAKSEEELSNVDPTKVKPKLNFTRKSNFETCEMKFKDDFYNAMVLDGSIDLEIAMLAFDFVITGNADNDYWRTNKNDAQTSLHARLKKIGEDHIALRQKNHKDIEDINKRLTCMCLDVKGYDNIENAEKKAFFKDSCEEYANYENPEASIDDINGDASGIKGKRLLVTWTSQLQGLHVKLAYDNSSSSKQFQSVLDWANGAAKWGETRMKNYDLYAFIIKNPSGSVAALGAFLGALLAAGVLAVLGGFSASTLISTWAAIGIISSAAVTTGGGLWLIASLKGAWITSRPYINDYYHAPRKVSCGKKNTCYQHTRTLMQPYNEVCDIHASANACIKSFLVVNEENGPRYLVDPWIPVGVDKNKILNGQPDYAITLNASFERARSAMRGRAVGGRLNESYLKKQFIDASIVGMYTPMLKDDLEATYVLSASKKDVIKEAAKKFAVEQGVMLEADKENLEAFAEYAYQYHFVWPKKTRPGEISYPTVAMHTYMSYLTNEVSANLSADVADRALNLGNLGAQYAQSYLETLNAFKKDTTSGLNDLQKGKLDDEIAKTQKELDRYAMISSIVADKGLVSELLGLNDSFLDTRAKSLGVSASSLGVNDKNFLRAVGTLRDKRQKQVRALAQYKKEMADNGNSARADRMAAASSRFSSRFGKTNGSSGVGGSSLAGFGSGSDSSSSNSASSGSGSGGFNSGIDQYGLANVGAAGFGATSSPSYGSRGSNSGSGNRGGSDSSLGARSYNAADNARLQDAVDARDKLGKDRYSSTNGNTIFEKITNAYIRNYDKVLIKRSDKDVIEDKK